MSSAVQDQVAEHGGPAFAERAALWTEVIESLGEQQANARDRP